MLILVPARERLKAASTFLPLPKKPTTVLLCTYFLTPFTLNVVEAAARLERDPYTNFKIIHIPTYFFYAWLFQVKYKKHKRANNPNGKSSSNPNTPIPGIQPPSSSTSAMMMDPFRRPRSESSGGGDSRGLGGSSMDNKYVISTSPATCLPSMTTLPPVQVTSAGPPMEMYTNPNKGLLGGVNILRAALTGSNDVIINLFFCNLFKISICTY